MIMVSGKISNFENQGELLNELTKLMQDYVSTLENNDNDVEVNYAIADGGQLLLSAQEVERDYVEVNGVKWAKEDAMLMYRDEESFTVDSIGPWDSEVIVPEGWRIPEIDDLLSLYYFGDAETLYEKLGFEENSIYGCNTEVDSKNAYAYYTSNDTIGFANKNLYMKLRLVKE